MNQWFELKNLIELWSGLDRDSLHIYAAVGIQLTTALLLRSSLASIWPWLVALTATLLNEAIDMSQFDSLHAIPDYFLDAVIRDIWNSMLLPSLFYLLSRFMPQILTGSGVVGR